jgi:hypothetical protein
MKSLRSDLHSEINTTSGSLVLIPLEKFQELIGFSDDEDFEIISEIIDNGGDIININPYVNLEVRKRFTLNTDGTNDTVIQIAPKNESKDFVRLLNKDEETLEEFSLRKKKELKMNTEEMIKSFTDIRNEYLEKMDIND